MLKMMHYSHSEISLDADSTVAALSLLGFCPDILRHAVGKVNDVNIFKIKN